jgi:predicted DCC family thiol-disulfide oxidoreductase YuxK
MTKSESNLLDDPKGTVLYDETCPLCRSLAELLGRRAQGALLFRSWQSYWSSRPLEDAGDELSADAPVPEAPDQIYLVMGRDIYGGIDAWQRMLGLHPDFAGLNWLAAQLGLARPLARVTEGTATFLRRFCSRCPR